MLLLPSLFTNALLREERDIERKKEECVGFKRAYSRRSYFPEMGAGPFFRAIGFSRSRDTDSAHVALRCTAAELPKHALPRPPAAVLSFGS